MEKVGATDLNGTTNEDRTNYFEDVPASALDYRSCWSPTAWAICSAPSIRKSSISSAAWCKTKNARARTALTP